MCRDRSQPYLERNEEVHGLPNLLLDGLAKVSGQLQPRPLCGHRRTAWRSLQAGNEAGEPRLGPPLLPSLSPGPKGHRAPAATASHCDTGMDQGVRGLFKVQQPVSHRPGC